MGDNPDDYELKIELSIITASNTEKETLIIRTFILKANIREILEKTIDELFDYLENYVNKDTIKSYKINLLRFKCNDNPSISDIKLDCMKLIEMNEIHNLEIKDSYYISDILQQFRNDKWIKNYYLSCAFTISFTKFSNFYEHEFSYYFVYYIKENFKNIDDNLYKKLEGLFIYRLTDQYEQDMIIIAQKVIDFYNSNFVYSEDDEERYMEATQFLQQKPKIFIKINDYQLNYHKASIKDFNKTEFTDPKELITVAYKFLMLSVFFYKKSELETELDFSNGFFTDNHISSKYLPPLYHALSILPHLRILNLSDNDFSEQYSLVGLGKVLSVTKSLEILSLANCKITKDSFRNFKSAACYTDVDLVLKEFDISNNYHNPDYEFYENIIELLIRSPYMKDLILNKNSFENDNSEKFFQHLNQLTNEFKLSLKRIYLNSMNISEKGMASLGYFLSNIKNTIETVSLSDNYYKDDLFIENKDNKETKKVRKFPNIKEIAMLKCGIEKITEITEFLKYNKNIESFILHNNEISNTEEVIYLFESLLNANGHKLLNIDLGRNSFVITKDLADFFEKNRGKFQDPNISNIKVIDLTVSVLTNGNKVPDLTSSFIIVKDKEEPYKTDQFHFEEYYIDFYKTAIKYQNDENYPIQLLF